MSAPCDNRMRQSVRHASLVLAIVVGCLCSETSFAVGDVNFLTRSDISAGQLFPGNVSVYAGETIYMRVVNAVDEQVRCVFRRPGGIDTDVSAGGGDNRVTAWPEHQCGIRVRNAATSDSGHWRLTSSRDGNMTRGYTFVSVAVAPVTGSTDIRPLESADDLLTPDGTSYCYVLRPELNADSFPQHDACTISRGTGEAGAGAVQSSGLWNVVVGQDGRTDEMQFMVNVAAKVEDLSTFVRTSTDNTTIQLGCNLLNSPKRVTFCRFLRLSDGVGFNVEPGQGNERYSYAGAGLEAGECGLHIAAPTDFDRYTWKCFLGYSSGSGSNIMNGTLGAIVDASTVPKELVPQDLQADSVYGLNGTAVSLLCKAPIGIDYCWFTHPLGQRISVNDRLPAAPEATESAGRFDYFGAGLRMGECGVTVRVATLEDSGGWQCHLGTFRRTGWETSRAVAVRVSDSHLVAAHLRTSVLDKTTLHLDCTTIPVRQPLQFCRFVMPDGRGFSIDEQVTEANSLDGIYFQPGRRMIDGYCSIVVRTVDSRHSGQWTCAGRLIGRDEESSDDFEVLVNETVLSAAALSGMVIGALLIVILLMFVGVRGYRRRRRLSAEEPMTLELQEDMPGGEQRQRSTEQ